MTVTDSIKEVSSFFCDIRMYWLIVGIERLVFAAISLRCALLGYSKKPISNAVFNTKLSWLVSPIAVESASANSERLVWISLTSPYSGSSCRKLSLFTYGITICQNSSPFFANSPFLIAPISLARDVIMSSYFSINESLRELCPFSRSVSSTESRFSCLFRSAKYSEI